MKRRKKEQRRKNLKGGKIWEESKNTIYKPTVTTSQMQSYQETLTRNCVTKAGTWKSFPKVSHRGPRISRPIQADGCDGRRGAKHIRSAMGDETGKRQNRRCHWSRLRWDSSYK